MTSKERLDEIENTLRLNNDLFQSQYKFLISRVRTLTAALEFYADMEKYQKTLRLDIGDHLAVVPLDFFKPAQNALSDVEESNV